MEGYEKVLEIISWRLQTIETRIRRDDKQREWDFGELLALTYTVSGIDAALICKGTDALHPYNEQVYLAAKEIRGKVVEIKTKVDLLMQTVRKKDPATVGAVQGNVGNSGEW